jgi:hypothetical protein
MKFTLTFACALALLFCTPMHAQDVSLAEKTEAAAFELFADLVDQRWDAEWDFREAQSELARFSLSEPPPALAAQFQIAAKRIRRLDSRIASSHITWGWSIPDFKGAKAPPVNESTSAAFPLAKNELNHLRRATAKRVIASLPKSLPSLHPVAGA